MERCNWNNIILHIDMDAFFAQVEERDHPWLKGKPVIIGGLPGHRGVASTCNYRARKYGVHSGMSLTECVRLCPKGVFLRTNGRKYSYVSLQVLEVLRSICDSVEMSSIDEAYLDMSRHRGLYSSLSEMGMAVKRGVWDKVGLTCSVGIGPNKYVAKMSTGENKPDGLTILDIEGYREVFAPRPVSKLIGVGDSTEKALNSLGIRTIGQLQKFPEKILEARFGVNGPRLKEMANGEYDGRVARPFEQQPEDKSVGHERTYRQDVSDSGTMAATLLELSSLAARRLRQGNYEGRRVTVKIRYGDFSTFTHQATMNYFTNDEGEIYRVALKCWDEAYVAGREVRLIGVRVSHLRKTSDSYSTFQGDLFKGEVGTKKHRVLRAADSIKDRFGEKALYYAGVAT